MAIKIQINGAALQVADLTEGKIVILEPSNSVWYVEKELVVGKIQFYDSNGRQRVTANKFPSVLLSEAVDGDGIAFTESTFRDFVYNNLGSDISSVSPTFIDRMITDGNTVYNNPCA